MTSGFVGLIGRWYRRHIAEPMPEQKGVFHATSAPLFTWNKPPDFFEKKGAVKGAASEPELSQPVSGVVVGGQQSWEQVEIFEGMVGFMNLCKIARAADNLEALMREDHEADILELAGDEDGAAFIVGALNELNTALKPYRNARELSRAKR